MPTTRKCAFPLPADNAHRHATRSKVTPMQFEGIYTPIVTPFHADFTCNQDALSQTVEHLIAAGVHGIIVAGPAGEYYAQTMKERVWLMGRIHEMIADRLPMIVGTGAVRTEDSVEYARQAKRHGADALLVTTPPCASATGQEVALHALAIDAEADLPVMLCNCPGRMSVHMDAGCLDQLRGSPNFCAIRESSGDMDRLHMLARDYPHIALSCGVDDQALEFFAWGARSWVCAGSNFAPEAHLALYRACAVEGDFTKGRALMSAMLPLMRVLEQGGKLVQSVKHGLTLRGIEAGPPRKPLQPLSEDEGGQLSDFIKTMNVELTSILGDGWA